MKNKYSVSLIVSLCGLSFIIGRLLQLGPSLPSGTIELPKVRQTPRLTLENPVLPPPGRPHDFSVAVDPVLHDRPPIDAAPTGLHQYTTQPFQLLSWKPRMYLFPKFLTDEECDNIVREANARLVPSSLAFRKGDSAETTKNIRTSQGTFMSRSEDPTGTLAKLEDKIAIVTGLPVNHGEAFNILRYKLGQHYNQHYDYFEEDGYGKMQSNRLATVLMYLTSVDEGGETIFPLEGEHGLEQLGHINYKDCDHGFKYKPRKGDALLFYSMHPNNTLDRHSLHGGCPVIQGEKWVATKWIHQQCNTKCPL